MESDHKTFLCFEEKDKDSLLSHTIVQIEGCFLN